jgi:hypothetical protein
VTIEQGLTFSQLPGHVVLESDERCCEPDVENSEQERGLHAVGDSDSEDPSERMDEGVGGKRSAGNYNRADDTA